MDTCSNRIKIAMQTFGITQAELVRRTGISKGALSSYLSGRYSPKQKTLYILAEQLDVSAAWLMGYDVPMQRNNNNRSDKTDTSISIGNQLEELEKSHHYSEEFVAESIGIPVEYYRVMKRGENRVFDSNLMLKFSSFYHKRWTDFFPSNIQMPSINDNICALQVMSGRTDEEICNYLGISQEEYLSIASGKKRIDFELLEKFNSFYNMTFSSLLGTDFGSYTDDPKKRLSVKMQAYLNDIYKALDGEEFNPYDMKELLDYIGYISKTKKIKRMKGE